MPGRLMAGQRVLSPSIEVRVLARQLCRRARLRPSPRKAGGPARHRVAAPGPRSPMAGGTSMRRWAVCVRIAPGTRTPPWRSWQRSRPVSGRSPGRNRPEALMAARGIGRPAGPWPRNLQVRGLGGQQHALRAGAHLSSVGTDRPARHWGRAPGGCSSVGRARRRHRRGRRFEAGHPLQADLAQLVRGAALRPRRIRVRIPGSVRREGWPSGKAPVC
jgi:hypothetical protein